ncbi:hypothetical protein C8R43DRAFT_1131031 [Mycena crocata]|nr:hypothetical protein C8R43DRAFT_1131031 [Mycena crocata]
MSSVTSTPIDTILGAVVLTGILGALFFGAACIQTYNYYLAYRSDDILLKGAVGPPMPSTSQCSRTRSGTTSSPRLIRLGYRRSWIGVSRHCVLCGGVHLLTTVPCQLSTWLSVALVLLLDVFYTIWLTKLAPRYIFPAFVGVAVAAGNIVAVVLGVRIIIFTHFTNIYAISSTALIYLFFILFCVKSVAISGVMVYCLYSSNEGFTVESNSNIVRRAMKLALGSSLVIAVCSFCVLACHLAMPRSMACVVVYMVVSKLYHNCFLFLLACRPLHVVLMPMGHAGMPMSHGHDDIPMRHGYVDKQGMGKGMERGVSEDEGSVSVSTRV